MSAKILFIDIETAPILANVWGLFKQNVGLSQIRGNPYVLSWAAKWKGEDTVYYDALPDHKATYKADPEDDSAVIRSARDMLDEADIVVGHNARNFDVKWLNGRMLIHGVSPPAPFKIVDTLATARQRFRLASNRLDYLGEVLGLGKKLKTDFDLWVDCMQGKKKAWDMMVDYNIQDVVLLEAVYDELLPWIHNHPNVALYDDDETMRCGNCGGTHLTKRGYVTTTVAKYQRYQCQDCGTWRKGGQVQSTKEKRKSILRSIPNG